MVVIGGGDRERELKRIAGSLGIGDQVIWHGWAEDMASVLGACDVLALSSKDEGTPVAIIEALALGLPVVATGVGGVSELLSDVAEARVVPPGCPASFGSALRGLAANPRPVSQRVRERVVRRFSVDRLVDDVGALYKRELKRAGVGGEWD